MIKNNKIVWLSFNIIIWKLFLDIIQFKIPFFSSLSSLKENSPSNTELEQQQQLQSITTTPATTELKLHLLTTTTATRNSIVVKSSTSLSPVYEKEKSSLITDMTNSSSEMDLKSEDSSCLSPDKKSYSSSESLDTSKLFIKALI